MKATPKPLPKRQQQAAPNRAAKRVTAQQYAKHVQNCVPCASPYP
jgi:hypothetical protein